MGAFAIEFEGMEELIESVRSIATQEADTSKMLEAGTKATNSMREKYRAYGVKTGLLSDPRITHAWTKSSSDKKSDALYFGVIKYDAVMREYGLDPAKDIPPNVLAYWIEYGAEPHLTISGFDLRRKSDRAIMAKTEPHKIHKGILAQPILTRAALQYESEIMSGIEFALDSKVNKALK